MSEDLRNLYDIRDGVEADRNFILATFLRGLYYGDSWFSIIPKQVFMENYKKVIIALLKIRLVKVACLKEDPDVILGYCIMTPDQTTVDWVFVKSAWRKQGIGSHLIPHSVATFTHLSATGKKLIQRYPNSIFNPFLT